MSSTEKILERIERQLKALVGELQNATRALVGIHDVLKESNRGRDRWARAVVDVFEEAKGETSADPDGG
jgi:hypothetical protein